MGGYIFFLVFVFVLAILAVMLDLRGGWRRWGATDEEVQGRYVAQDYIPNAKVVAVRGITIYASPEKIWPWIAQLARGAGFYSWDMLDNIGYRSADYLLHIPKPAIGDTSIIGKVMHVEQNKTIAWLIEKTPWVRCKWDVCFNYVIEPKDNCRTRLLLVMRGRFHGNRFWGAVGALINDTIETIMGVKQLKQIKYLVETYPERLEARQIHKSSMGHQRSEYTYVGDRGMPAVRDSDKKEKD